MDFYAITLATPACTDVRARTARPKSGAIENRAAFHQTVIDLLDTPAAQNFAAQLPLPLEFKDYAGAEKIATLPKRLSPRASPSGREVPVDFAYFVPWGNLAIYYKGLGDDGQPLALGRIRTGTDVLGRQHTNFMATLELLQP